MLSLKMNGEEIPAKVQEINENIVKYKQDSAGPIYNMPVKDIFTIKYANGRSDSFVNKPHVKANRSKYDSLMNKVKDNRIGAGLWLSFGSALIICGAVLVTIAPAKSNNGLRPNSNLDYKKRNIDIGLGSHL